MKQQVSAPVVVVVLLVVVAVAAALLWRTWHAPSAQRDPSAPTKPQMGKESHGPTPDQLKQIQEWKKKNPGAYTKF